jgi:hypothetical protein
MISSREQSIAHEFIAHEFHALEAGRMPRTVDQ